ncbi:outer membrane protein assembly factor BamB [Tamilnaduibacter salinus]|uniref:Outer membrane protein assembly factor BamB n=1 Tax=Tamilnaduibacter salinus TaxID=1484056 RepID=A0A2A2I3U6_9GAMM|nr:outer membrane protein assembly factor BamB [Tamilnaduibacter salinus]PAV26262.1 outer membrane protein assembly factor BamB [Tamilnaduibacter salinus]
MPAALKRAALGLAALSVAALLTACGSTDSFEEPAPLPEISASVWLETAWDRSVGDGHDEQLLFLQPALVEGTLYAVSADGELQAVNPDNGELQWERELPERILAGVGADQSRLFLGSRDGKLLALSRTDGASDWSASLPSEVVAPPQSNGDVVVAHTIDGKVLGFDAASGERRWQYDGQIPVLSFRGNATPRVGADLTLVAFANGQVVALDSATGEPAWQYRVGEPVGRTELERLVDVDGTPLVRDDVVYVTGYQGKVAALDLTSGQELWSRESSSLESPELAYGNVFVSGYDGVIRAFSLNSRQELWAQSQLEWRRVTGLLAVDGVLLTGDFEGYIHILSQLDGSLLGQREVDDEGLRVPMLRYEDMAIVYSNSGELVAYRIQKQD